jgi:hypothetical protein
MEMGRALFFTAPHGAITHIATTNAKTTMDHETIRDWSEQRGGAPAIVNGSEQADSNILRIAFPENREDKNLKKITWEEFFDAFDDTGLVFLYQEKTKDGKESRFNKFVSHDEGMEQELASGADEDELEPMKKSDTEESDEGIMIPSDDDVI